jgi:hypothetical protein
MRNREKINFGGGKIFLRERIFVSAANVDTRFFRVGATFRRLLRRRRRRRRRQT